MQYLLAALLSLSVAAALTTRAAASDSLTNNSTGAPLVSAADALSVRRPAVPAAGSNMSRKELLERVNRAMGAQTESRPTSLADKMPPADKALVPPLIKPSKAALVPHLAEPVKAPDAPLTAALATHLAEPVKAPDAPLTAALATHLAEPVKAPDAPLTAALATHLAEPVKAPDAPLTAALAKGPKTTLATAVPAFTHSTVDTVAGLGLTPPSASLIAATVHTGDFNDDGWLDLIVFWRDRRSNTPFAPIAPTVYMGDNQGGLTRTPIDTAQGDLVRRGPGIVLVADFNGDGRDDVFVSGGADGSAPEPMLLLLSGPNGRLHNETARALPNHRPWEDPQFNIWGAAVGDVDGDGDLDILVGTQPHVLDYMTETTSVRLFINNADGQFFDATDALPMAVRQAGTQGAHRLTTLTLEDFNGDGAADLALLSPTKDKSLIFINAGFGDFTKKPPMETSELGLERIRQTAREHLQATASLR